MLIPRTDGGHGDCIKFSEEVGVVTEVHDGAGRQGRRKRRAMSATIVNWNEALRRRRRRGPRAGRWAGAGRIGKFVPAFSDTTTGAVYLSRFVDGRPAPIHVYETLPDALVMRRDALHRPLALRADVISGFFSAGRFYTREQAARVAVTRQSRARKGGD